MSLRTRPSSLPRMVDGAAGHVHQTLTRLEQHGGEQRRDAAHHVDANPSLAAEPTKLNDESSDVLRAVAQLAAEQRLAAMVDGADPVHFFGQVDSDEHIFDHSFGPFAGAPKRTSPAVHALHSDGFPNGTEPVSHRRALDFIQSRYMLSLTEAPFDVTNATLHPEAGACSTCPKRTGNQRELFSDVASEDVCTDPDCFAEKKERVWQLRVERAKEAGQEVLAAKDAKKVFLYADEVSPQSGFVKLDDVCEVDPNGRTWRKLLGKNAPTVTIARDGRGLAHELAALDDVAKALKTAGRTFKIPKARRRGTRRTTAASESARRRRGLCVQLLPARRSR